MHTRRAEHDAICIDWQGTLLFLRPSLRAALRLARYQGGFAALLRKTGEFDTSTIREIIRASSTDPIATESLLRGAAKAPLASFVEATQAPVIELLTDLLSPADDTNDTPAESSTPMSFEQGFAQLYRIATGWLGWPPGTAWHATPAEITEAMEGHVEKLVAMSGQPNSVEANQKPSVKPLTQGELERMQEHGDPAFDREAFKALRAKHAGQVKR